MHPPRTHSGTKTYGSSARIAPKVGRGPGTSPPALPSPASEPATACDFVVLGRDLRAEALVIDS